MNPNNPEQLLNKYNAVLKTNIVMAEAIGNYSREVMLLKRGNERLSNSNQRLRSTITEIEKTIFSAGCENLDKYNDCSTEIAYLLVLESDLYDQLVDKSESQDQAPIKGKNVPQGFVLVKVSDIAKLAIAVSRTDLMTYSKERPDNEKSAWQNIADKLEAMIEAQEQSNESN